VAKQALELEKEIDKRTKWEELLEIKEEDLNKLGIEIEQQNQHLGEENVRRAQAEKALRKNQKELDKVRSELDGLAAKYDQQLQQEIDKRSQLETLFRNVKMN